MGGQEGGRLMERGHIKFCPQKMDGLLERFNRDFRYTKQDSPGYNNQ
jgi:hypothetical protein